MASHRVAAGPSQRYTALPVLQLQRIPQNHGVVKVGKDL